MKEIITYETRDGEIFTEKQQAEMHELRLVEYENIHPKRLSNPN